MKNLLLNKSLIAPFCLLLIPAVLPGCSKGGGETTEPTAGPPATLPKPAPKPVVKTPSDLDFAKTSFTALTKGQASAIDAIDWEKFTAMKADMGKVYKSMPDDKSKQTFCKSFVSSFSSSFTKAGGDAGKMKNWRVKSKDATSTVVAADLPKSTIAITITKSGGKQKLSSLMATKR